MQSDALHSAIMNLPCKPSGFVGNERSYVGAYEKGHRDARHAAAELVSAVLSAGAPGGVPSEPHQERARQLVEDWHEGIPKGHYNDWCNRAAGLLLHFADFADNVPRTGLDPEMGWIMEAATKGELAAYDTGSAEMMGALQRILDGKDDGAGVANEPWESLRRRVIALVANAPQAVRVPLTEAERASLDWLRTLATDKAMYQDRLGPIYKLIEDVVPPAPQDTPKEGGSQ